MTTSNPNQVSIDEVELAPSYKIPLVLLLGAIPLALVQVWLGVAIAIFGLFLMVQAAIIRLRFSDRALDVYRGKEQIRSFPYDEWLNWEIFWPKVPILFYFREVNSIHFLPIIFDYNALVACLEKYCPTTES